MEYQEKLALINENLAKVLNPELIERPLAEGRNPRIYWVGSLFGEFGRDLLTDCVLRALRQQEDLITHTCELFLC
jgi:hypothetical protein